MALPYLLKHIYNNATDEVIRRAKKIFSSNNLELIEYDALLDSIVFRVKDDAYATYYKVHVYHFKNQQALSLRCSCPYNLSEICRHEAAALFQLQEMLDKNLLQDKEVVYEQKHTVVKMKQPDLKMIRMLTSAEHFAMAEHFLKTQKAHILQAKDERVVAEVNMQQTFQVVLQKNEERNFDTSCSCQAQLTHPLCVHKAIVFMQLLSDYGPNYFDTIRNWDKEKNKLLNAYGYSLEDDINGKFEFVYKEGKPFLRVLDYSIKKLNLPVTAAVKTYQKQEATPVLTEETKWKEQHTLGIVFSYNGHQYPYIQIDAVKGEPDETQTTFVSKVEKLDILRFASAEGFNEEEIGLLQQIRKLLPEEVTRYLNRNSPFSGLWEHIVQPHDEALPQETRNLIIEYLYPKYKKLFLALEPHSLVFYLPLHSSFKTSHLQQAACSTTWITPHFHIQHFPKEKIYEISCKIKTNSGETDISENQWASPLLFLQHNHFYLWEKQEDIAAIEFLLPSGKLIISEENWQQALHNHILPLSKKYSVHFHNIKKEEWRDVKPKIKIVLKEKGDYLIFQPLFEYQNYEVQPADKERVLLSQPNQSLLIIHRNIEAETALWKKIKNLHSNFVATEQGALALKGSDVLKNNWFFLFIEAVKEMNISVYGFESLKHFRFSTSKPSTKIYISSNTDWFDAKINIHFGNQQVTIAEIKKALSNHQQFVPLQDGSLGILPEEWIQKYSLLFRMGEGKAEHLKLSKYHYNIIDELYAQRNQEELALELEEKYEQLKQNLNIAPAKPSAYLQKILRPYQVAGFQWLHYLHTVHWGGILADDMGLGKTIQALSFLQYLKEHQNSLKALVVCPTTLIYNWENEIKKFTPSLTHTIHHGGGRIKENLANTNTHIIITTYGTLRSDIKLFANIHFDYIILDESQAIKNPSSKIAKAVCLLQAKSKLCLTGTPLQNNTFDIYAQMNFLNPGMLGSMEFFKQEFAIPIDKFGEKEQKEHLRKLLFPFILRRTKEQVAKDLPSKTESVLYCEMNNEQQNIYDAYRNDYRSKILGIVENEGIQKSQLTILQGLMKLRQICDSPAILKEENFPNISVKLEELSREITENISNHKALVFSQFLGMLSLIKERLHELKIPFEYFDGSTSVQQREKAIQRFQTDESCRIFLISLKAGGIGLNLTAADYVYIIDPWWNPAVEQQAIDRTHRIGQTKNIIAYRMICKNTVEDKILQLQEKKRLLAADLITDESGFVKSLTKEDIEYLFS